MILIADSGSTKTDWCVVLNGTVIKATWNERDQPFLPVGRRNPTEADSFPSASTAGREINAVYFYGAGCTPEKAPVLRRAIADSLPVIGNIKANSDMLAAAHGYVARRLVSPVFWGRGPILVFTMEKRSSVTSLLSDLFWEMKVAVPYLENCW